MDKIVYTIKVTGVNEKQQEVVLEICASNASDLLNRLKEVLDKKSKFSILEILGLN